MAGIHVHTALGAEATSPDYYAYTPPGWGFKLYLTTWGYLKETSDKTEPFVWTSVHTNRKEEPVMEITGWSSSRDFLTEPEFEQHVQGLLAELKSQSRQVHYDGKVPIGTRIWHPIRVLDSRDGLTHYHLTTYDRGAIRRVTFKCVSSLSETEHEWLQTEIELTLSDTDDIWQPSTAGGKSIPPPPPPPPPPPLPRPIPPPRPLPSPPEPPRPVAEIAGAPRRLAGQEMPAFKLAGFDGKDHTLASMLDDTDNLLLICIWQVACKPCNLALAFLADLQARCEGQISIVVISRDEELTLGLVEPYFRAKDWPFQVLLDPSRDYSKQLGIESAPHFYLVNKQKAVLWEGHYYKPERSEEIENEIRAHLNSGPVR